MPPILASPISRYGVPVDFDSELYQFANPAFPFVKLVRYTATLCVDVGLPEGNVSYRFVSVFVLVGDRLVGPILYLDDVSSDEGGDGGEKSLRVSVVRIGNNFCLLRLQLFGLNREVGFDV